jgi:putative isomerase
MIKTHSVFLERLRGRINLEQIPFSERGSRLLVFRRNDSLSIRLAERWAKWEAEVGHYRQRRPVLDDFQLTDEQDVPLDLNITAYPHAVFIETRLGEFWLTFLDEETLYLKLPAARGGISFRVMALNARADRRGGEFKGDPEHRRTHRNVAYTTNARLIENEIINGALANETHDGYARVKFKFDADADSAVVLNITPRLGLRRSVPHAETVLQNAEKRWHDWFAAAPTVDEAYASQYYYAWWILRAGLLSSRFFLTREAMMPSMLHYVGVWAWDAFFHALAYQYIDAELAENQIRILLDHQRDDGLLPDAVHDEGIITRWEFRDRAGNLREADVTKPPLVAWTALKLYQTSGNRDFLQEIYEPVTRWNHWWFQQNDDDHDGIIQYNHPNSSGLDDSPLWDEGMPVESPDLNTYLVLQLDALARIAEILDLPADAAEWRAQADALTARVIQHFWDETAGVFWATRDNQPLHVLTAFNLYPLLTGRLDKTKQQRLLEHLFNPNEFWLAYPIPTVAKKDPQYDPQQMWRGPTWVNINYLFIEGLARCGERDAARLLRDKTLELLMGQNDIYEYYNPETGKPPPRAASVFGWSSAVFVDLAIKASRGEII